jgi:protocatechuate 3,4-dioxygenase, alpha subunit
MSGATPSQTVGPFFSFGLRWLESTQLVGPDHPARIVIQGAVLDGDGIGVPDALIETFQADGAGNFGPASDSNWLGFGRILTDEDGRFAFTTVKPGLSPTGDGATEAPHLTVSVFARGLLQRVITRIYFPDEEVANQMDPVLNTITPERRSTLLAVAADGRLSFNIHLQGENETVFFNC